MNDILGEGSVLGSHERHSQRYFDRVSQILIENIKHEGILKTRGSVPKET